MRVVLDTGVLIEGLAEPIDAELAISTVSLAELHFGVLAARRPEQRAGRLRRLAELERAFEALPVTDTVARAYGAIAATVVAAGRPRRRAFDLLIAATASVHEAAVLTRNPTDFTGLDDFVEIIPA